jgi:hypothetical protein
MLRSTFEPDGAEVWVPPGEARELETAGLLVD